MARNKFEEIGGTEREAVILELNGDCCSHEGLLEKATDMYSNCLMIVQEEENLAKEAEVS